MILKKMEIYIKNDLYFYNLNRRMIYNKLPVPIQDQIKHYNEIQKYIKFIEEQDNNIIEDILHEIYYGYRYLKDTNDILFHKSYEDLQNDLTPNIKKCKKYLMSLNINKINYILEPFYNN